MQYGCFYLKSFETDGQARAETGTWLEFYNYRRPHSTFDGQTPDEVYNEKICSSGLGLRPATEQTKNSIGFRTY